MNHLKSKDINIIIYAVYLIDNFLRKNEFDDNSLDILSEQIDIEYLLLLSSFLNKGIKKLSFSVLIILINV